MTDRAKKELIFWFFVLTIGFLNGMLVMFDEMDGTDNAMPFLGCFLMFVILRVGIFWEDIKEKLL